MQHESNSIYDVSQNVSNPPKRAKKLKNSLRNLGLQNKSNIVLHNNDFNKCKSEGKVERK